MKTNPGMDWHLVMMKAAEEGEKIAKKKLHKMYYGGMRDAHYASFIKSKALGINPAKKFGKDEKALWDRPLSAPYKNNPKRGWQIGGKLGRDKTPYYIGFGDKEGKERFIFRSVFKPTRERYPMFARVFGPFKNKEDAMYYAEGKDVHDI